MFIANYFDTHENIKILMDSGFSEKQAEGQVKVVSKLIESNLATKHDLQQMESKLENKMQHMESKLLTEILHVRSETIKWVAGMMVAQAAVFVAILKLFNSF
jgi:hypothetical protein